MGSGGPRGLQILLPGAKTIRGGFDSHTFPPYLHPAHGRTDAPGSNGEKQLSLRRLIIPSVVLSALIAGTACFAGETGSGPGFPAMALRARADTTAKSVEQQEWSSEHIKELLAKETGEPDIEGSAWKRRKNPRTAMLCSIVFPGLGQIYNEKAFKAVIAFGVETYYLMNILHNYRMADDWFKKRESYDRFQPCFPGSEDLCLNSDGRHANAWYEEYTERTIDWVWWTAGVVLIVMLDAYVDAHLHDMRFRVETARRGGGSGLAVVVDF